MATIAAFLPEDDRTPAQVEATVLANTLLAEVQLADAAILAVPLYNYGVSQHFKAWIYLIIAVAGPTAPALEGKPTVFVTTSGGGYGPGTPRQGWDHSTGYLERILRDFGRADLIVIKHGLTLAGVKPEMDGLRDLADQQHLAAQDAARKAGRVLAGS